jgi:hypothetical protein
MSVGIVQLKGIYADVPGLILTFGSPGKRLIRLFEISAATDAAVTIEGEERESKDRNAREGIEAGIGLGSARGRRMDDSEEKRPWGDAGVL